LKAILPLTVWTVVITVLLLMPTYDLKIEDFGIQDKLVHMLLFGVLCFLILNYHFYKKRIISIKSLFIAVFMSSAYGFIIECLQDVLNTGRDFDSFDIIANINGSLIGSIIFYLLRKIKS